LFLEDGLLKTLLKKIEKHAEKVFDIGEGASKGAEKKERFNTFLLTDALGRKDKKNLWVLYQKALEAQTPVEEIHGILFWQMKSLALAENSNSPTEAGMKAYPYQKAKEFVKKFEAQEIRDLRKKLVYLYHDAHRGEFDLAEGLERFILEL
jgi:hypothetical protein